MPDPVLSLWKPNDDKLKKQAVAKKERSVEPEPNPDYPTKVQIALNLLQEFNDHHNDIRVLAVLADALYGEANFLNQASKIFGGVQVISQLSKNQNIWYRGNKKSINCYFNSTNKGVNQIICIRGGEKIMASVSSARLKVDGCQTVCYRTQI